MCNHFPYSAVVVLCSLPLLLGSVRAEIQPCSVAPVEDYAGWGWKSWVMKNGLITLAVAPEIGGRVMQYDLDGHPSIYVNPEEVGKRYTPSQQSGWPNYGGYKTWPAPQHRWLASGGGWPPPPNLDFGPYSCRIVTDTPESSVVRIESPVETFSKWRCHGLKFERQLTIYRGSTRVRVEQTLTNKGSQKANWAIWDVTQSIAAHRGKADYGNFWVYFPIRADSRFGPDGYYVMSGDKEDSQWKSNIVPGVSAVQYLHHGGKIGADSDGGWICYVDRKDGYAYAKTFSFFKEQAYPDSGASVEVFTSAGLPYLEVEVLSPLVDLAPKQSYTFVENWYATRCEGPILEVNNVGVIKKRLTVQPLNDESARIDGAYGLFYQGEVRVAFQNAEGEKIGSGKSYPVFPPVQFLLQDRCVIPRKTRLVELQLYDAFGRFVGTLDSTPNEPE